MSELYTSSAHAAREVVAIRVEVSVASLARAFEWRDGEAKSSVVGATEVGVVESKCVFTGDRSQPFRRLLSRT